MLQIQEKPEGLAFKIIVQPRSSKNIIVGLMGDALKIKLTAPPVDNAANKLCIAFLADSLHVPKSRLKIISGHTSKTKQILLHYESNSKNAKEKANTRKKIIDLLPKDKKIP
jgi:hypothetical protein